ncbi:hypothetical protein BJX96DRAFT_186258 [Aspergillus floccosus]
MNNVVPWVQKSGAFSACEAGGDVAFWYNSSPDVVKLAATLENDFGVPSKAYKCFVHNFDELLMLLLKDFGGLHRVVNVDFSGAYYCARVAGQVFRKQGFGNIMFTASMSGHAATVAQQQAYYNTCKAGVMHLTRSLAIEWAGFARVNCVSPGYIDTPISRDCGADVVVDGGCTCR